MITRIFFGLKEDNLSQRNCQNQLSDPGLSHTGRMSGKFDSRKDSQSTKFEQRPRIFEYSNNANVSIIQGICHVIDIFFGSSLGKV